MSKEFEGDILSEEKEKTAVFYNEGFMRGYYNDPSKCYRIDDTENYDTNAGTFVQDGKTWYRVVYFKSGNDEYGRHHGMGVKIAEGKIDIEQIMKKAGELSGNERETGFKVEISQIGTERKKFFIVKPCFIPRNNREIWEGVYQKHNGQLDRSGSVFFDSREEMDLAITEAEKEYEQMIYGKKP